MAKRRLSQQQQRRIKQSHTEKQTGNSNNDSFIGLVISHKGGLIQVETDKNTVIKCKPRANLGRIICGDQVTIEALKNDFVIVAIQPRNNLIQRIDGFGKTHEVAANISQLIIFLSVVPEPNLFLLDQYLVTAVNQKITPIIVLNKTDLLNEAGDDPFNLKQIYQPLGHQVFHLSLKLDLGLEQLKSQFNNHTNLISGVSGAGKSSLVNAILPEQKSIKTAEISAFNKEGKHTTRTSTLYHLAQGGNLIDTPGVRGFNPVINDKSDIRLGFEEIYKLSYDCKFNNCNHINEPKCAVKQAFDEGHLATSRYEHYLKLMNTHLG